MLCLELHDNSYGAIPTGHCQKASHPTKRTMQNCARVNEFSARLLLLVVQTGQQMMRRVRCRCDLMLVADLVNANAHLVAYLMNTNEH